MALILESFPFFKFSFTTSKMENVSGLLCYLFGFDYWNKELIREKLIGQGNPILIFHSLFYLRPPMSLNLILGCSRNDDWLIRHHCWLIKNPDSKNIKDCTLHQWIYLSGKLNNLIYGWFFTYLSNIYTIFIQTYRSIWLIILILLLNLCVLISLILL